MPILIRAAFLLGCALLIAGSPALHAQGAEDRATAMPDGPGRSLVATQCAGCHALDVVLSRRATAEEWQTTVQKMIGLGAAITAQDAAAIAVYLGQHYGPGAPRATAAAAPQSAASALPDGPGKDVLMRRCFQCHQMSMWSALRQDRKAWESVIYRMIGRGALWTDEEINAMADYLARMRGLQ